MIRYNVGTAHRTLLGAHRALLGAHRLVKIDHSMHSLGSLLLSTSVMLGMKGCLPCAVCVNAQRCISCAQNKCTIAKSSCVS